MNSITKEGYKNTEIGVIPVEWEVVHLDDITIKITSGGTPSRSKDKYFTNGTINWLKTGELRDCYIYRAKEKITEEAINNSSAKLFPIDTLLIAMYGATIGQTAYLKIECATNQACCAIIFDKKLASPFFYWKYFYFIKDTLIGLGRGAGQPNISQGIIRDLKIPLPPLKEQEKIANILSTADDKISAIASQIEKAQTLKKGLLQKLLSEGIGHSEFKDSELGKIPVGWEVIRFRNIFERIMRKNIENNQNPLTISAQLGLVNQKEYFNKVVAGKNFSNYFLLHNGEFAYNKSYSAGYPMGVIKRLDKYDKGILSTLYICFKIINKNIDSNYILYYFYAGSFNKELSTIAQEGARNHGLLNVAINDFFSLRIILPPLKEQEKIAEILSTADEKLEVLRAKKEKYETLKKGLLQKLLSGEIRLFVV